MEGTGRVDAVAKAMRLLRVIGDAGAPLSLSEASRRARLHKSTALRLLSTLADDGMAARTPDGLWRLGPELRRLGGLPPTDHLSPDLVRPALDRLVAATQETASFYVRDGEERVILYRRNAPRAARHHLEEGARLDLSDGAAALVLRAFAGESGARMEEIRQAGHATSLGARDPDVAAVAVPVWRDGALAGALSVSGLIGRMDTQARARALAALQKEAETLSGA
ncbi:IclR family transcriptional regulator [Jannaschia aquimarina]|uniref:DNA-binding transcriptional activator MhpR n=1 Tax=Jannaschia aquimarina TaxID=935700 RepID=A0A0D1EN43_9RHOB|nr:helix-turn-helix domain-containing protein [Jannaschia aquimarina]KIT17120.1 DNA-binding transcriptional activator MhpR [Jannaschia aquimarina]SNS47280.1 transcriptional regulator, IclR family [Jannaschia aquimarina]